MKKSFKVLLLAVMALCLAASASFADDVVSYDITLDIQVGANMKTSHVKAYIGSKDGALSTDEGNKAVYVKSVNDGTSDTDGHEIHISYDVTIVEPKFSVKMTTADGTLASPIASISIGAVSSADSLVKIGTAGAKNANSEVTSWDAIPLPADGESYDLYIKTETASTSRYGTVVKLTVFAHVSKDAEPVVVAGPFESADVKVYADGVAVDTVKFTSKDYAQSVDVAAGTEEVSFDLKKYTVVRVFNALTSKDIDSADGVYSADVSGLDAGESMDIEIYFASADDKGGFKTVLTINISDDEDEGEGGTTSTYKLALASTDKFVFTSSTGLTDTFPASLDLFALSSDLASIDAAKAVWGAMTYKVSSDQFSSFSITLDYPASASVAALYYKETAAGTFEAGMDELDSAKKKLSPLEGYYKIVFSAGLVEDGEATDDKGYFAFTLQVASVDAGSTPGTSDQLEEETAESVVPETSGDNMIIPAGKTIKTRFLDSTGKVSTTIAAAFFKAATPRAAATPAQIEAALTTLGLTETDLGDETTGYKVVGITLPANIKSALYAGMKFFVMISTEDDGSGTNALGMGVLSKKQIGLDFFPIVFKLLKNPANTNEYMTFAQGNYYVGATNDMASTDNDGNNNRASVVFVAADGNTFTIATDEEQFLRGQTATAGEPALPSGDDDETDQVSSHGSSSGCDAGFGALALLAVAGALVARKVRK